MNRTIVNIVIDLIAACQLLGMLATGYILRFSLPPGSNKTLSLWSYTRHQWGDIHFWFSLGLLIILLVHLALHWNWIVTVIGKRCYVAKTEHPSLLRAGIVTSIIIALIMIVFGWMAQHSVRVIVTPMQGMHFGHSDQSRQLKEAIALNL